MLSFGKNQFILFVVLLESTVCSGKYVVFMIELDQEESHRILRFDLQLSHYRQSSPSLYSVGNYVTVALCWGGSNARGPDFGTRYLKLCLAV